MSGGLAASLAPRLPADNFRAELLEASTFPDACADVVISSAVLHFARDDDHFRGMLDGSWRLLAPGGLFFCRLASTIGLEAVVTLGPGGSRRVLASRRFGTVRGRRVFPRGRGGTVGRLPS